MLSGKLKNFEVKISVSGLLADKAIKDINQALMLAKS